MSGLVLSTLHILTHMLLMAILCGRYDIIVLTLRIGNLRHREVKNVPKVTQLMGG